MILDVHVAFLFAALCFMFGITYSIGQFMDRLIANAKIQKSQSTAFKQLEA